MESERRCLTVAVVTIFVVFFVGVRKWGDKCDNISSISCRRYYLAKFGLASRDAPLLHAPWTPVLSDSPVHIYISS